MLFWCWVLVKECGGDATAVDVLRYRIGQCLVVEQVVKDSDCVEGM
jgi:hypothetical protein